MTDLHPLPNSSTIMKITPEVATDWLENRNLSTNRNLSISTASRYAKTMSEGRWLLTHQGIAFDSDGFLIDGQHRLQAVILAATPIEMFVAVGFNNDTFAVLDSGLRRQAGQLVKGKYGVMLAAAARFLGAVDGTLTGHLASGVFAAQADNDQILAVVEAWPEAADHAHVAQSACAAARITPAPHLAVLAQAARTQYAPRLGEWGRGIVDGVGLEATDPRLVLRTRFIRDNKTFRGPAGRILAYAYTVKAWNAYAVGAELRFLRVRDDEQMPTVVS